MAACQRFTRFCYMFRLETKLIISFMYKFSNLSRYLLHFRNVLQKWRRENRAKKTWCNFLKTQWLYIEHLWWLWWFPLVPPTYNIFLKQFYCNKTIVVIIEIQIMLMHNGSCIFSNLALSGVMRNLGLSCRFICNTLMV